MTATRLAVCGGGNGAHALVPLALAAGAEEVVVYAPFGDEAERLAAGSRAGGLEAVTPLGSLWGRPAAVSADPAVVAGADVVALVTPSFAHDELLQAVTPHLRQGALVGALPARSGFEFAAAQVLGRVGRSDVTVFGLVTLPWACRIEEYGRRVRILGSKRGVGVATLPAGRAPEVAARLQRVWGTPCTPLPNFLNVTLGNVGQIIHPGIFYGLLPGGPAVTFAADEVPLFYQGVDAGIAALLETMSAEVQGVCRALLRALPGADLGGVLPLRDWLTRAYGAQIEDASTLARAFQTNRAYQGLRLPVRPAGEGRFAPDLGSRYLTEDVPYGLAVTVALAEMAGAPAPTLARIAEAVGTWLGRAYVHGGRLAVPEAGGARIPQRFGIRDLEALWETVRLGSRAPVMVG